MNTKPILRLALTALAFLLAPIAHAAPLSGTRTIGPTGDYASIGAAIVDIQAQTLGGALVLELQAGYLGSVETFPLVFASLGTTAANTVTLRPELGAAGLSLSSADTTAATVDLQGAQFLTIDGRPGGAGTVSQWSIANTHVAGVALRFINEASGNTVRYVALRGVNTSTTSGVVVFSTTTGANGNDGNTIDHCDIGDGASTPAHGLYALGTTTTAASAAVSVTGISFGGSFSSANVIARNLVHSLVVASTSASAAVNGIVFGAGSFTAQNNMVRVGLDVLGNPTAGASIVRGIQDNSVFDNGRNFYHNSAYVGGTETSGAANTFAFTSTGVSNLRTGSSLFSVE